MTIILFLIDTSASMNQRTYLGARPTLLDVAKDAVEKFLKIRQRDSASRGDRYMLLTFEDPPGNIKAGWKEHHNAFMNELKNLTASGMTTLGPSLKHALDLLNLNRMQTGIDTYGQGRCPFFLEPSIIIVITDGGRLSNSGGVQEELNLPMHSSVPGSELTKEPFRWDQRLFALVLRLTGTLPTEHMINGTPGSVVACDISPIDAMCDVTGGRSYAVSSQRSLMQCLESIVQKIQGGVVIHFEKVGPDPTAVVPNEDDQPQDNIVATVAATNGSLLNGLIAATNGCINGAPPLGTNGKPTWTSCRKLIYVQRSAQKGYSVGHWPLPESFWPDLNCPSLPPRSAHPVIKFTCASSEPSVIDNLPFDKYELESSSLTQFILSRKQPHVAWQCFIGNSHKSSELGLPFGYLKASTNLSCVNLFVLPYNYPVLLPLLDDLVKNLNCKPTREWKMSFDSYLKNLPLYYASPLKRALQRMGATPNLVPDNMENCLSYSVLNYLKRLKNQAKAEFDKMVTSVGSAKPIAPDTIRVNNTTATRKITDLSLGFSSSNTRFSGLKAEVNDYQGFLIRVKDKANESKAQCYRNPYDINRHELIDQIHRMRVNFLQPPGLIKFQDEDQIHSLPVSQMGNYQEYLKRMPLPLRELESAPVRQHMFGNPFKIDKRGMMIDEADIDLVGGGGNTSPIRSPKRHALESYQFGAKFKRRPGPLPRDFVIQRPSSPSPSPPASPLNSPPSSPCPSPSPPPPPSPTSSSLLLPSASPSSPLLLIAPCPPPTPPAPPASPAPVAVPDAVIEDSHPHPNPTSSPMHSPEVEVLTPMTTDSSEASPFMANHTNHDLDSDGARELKGMPDMEILTYPTPEPGGPSENSLASATYSPTLMEPINGRLSSNVNNGLSNHYTNGPLFNNLDGNNSGSKKLRLTQDEIKIKLNLFKMVRKPGKNFTPLLEELIRHKSPLRDYLLHEVVVEAKRFKRKSLIECLNQKFSDKGNPNNSNHVNLNLAMNITMNRNINSNINSTNRIAPNASYSRSAGKMSR